MSLYYEDEYVQLHHGDCLEILPTLTERVDVILTDPPFFMPATHYSSRTQWQRSWGDTSILASFWREFVKAATPRLKPSGYLVTFCDGDSYPVFYPELYRAFDTLSSLVWDKGRIGMGSPWRKQHELLIAARWAGAFKGADKGRSDVLAHKPVPSDDRGHPVDKPVSLLSEVLVPILPDAGVVLDPFAGGGSTVIAARNAGSRSIAIESEERYCELIVNRLAQQSFDFSASARAEVSEWRRDVLKNAEENGGVVKLTGPRSLLTPGVSEQAFDFTALEEA